MNLALLLAVLVLATFRLTRLVTRDDFPPILWARTKVQSIRPPRIVKMNEADSHWEYWWLGELVSCPWCASAYVSGGLVFATWLLHGLPLPVLCWLAVWGGGALLAYWADN